MLVLVNNAGLTADGLSMRLCDEDWDRVLETNLSAAFRLTRRAIRPMMRARFGRVVNVASVVGLRANAGQANYAASKAGLIAFTRTVAVEVARRGVTVNAVAPGLIETEMTAGIERPIAEAIPARRPGTPRGGRRLRRLPRLGRRLLRDRNNADRRRRNDRLTRKERSGVPETESATKEQIEQRVIEALVEFGEERDELTPRAKFADLDVDSLDLVELAQIVEDEYGIEVKDSDLDKIETVGDVVELVSQRLA